MQREELGFFFLQLFIDPRVDLVKELGMGGVPDDGGVELRLADTVLGQHLGVVVVLGLLMAVLQTRDLQQGIGLMQIDQHFAHLPGMENTARTAAGEDR